MQLNKKKGSKKGSKKRRILVVSSFFPPHVGGVETFLLKLIPLLKKNNCEVRTLGCDDRKSHSDIKIPVKLLKGIDWPMPYSGLFKFYKEIQKSDLVIANTWFHPFAPLACLLAKTAKKPIIVFPHCVDTGTISRQENISFREKMIYRLAGLWERAVSLFIVNNSTIYVLSTKEREYLIKKYLFSPGKIKSLKYPVSTEGFFRLQDFKKTGNELNFIWAGRFVSQKDPLLALQVAESARRKIPLNLHYYGEGPLLEKIKKEVVENNYDWVFIHGEVPPEEIRRQQSRGIVFSTSISEGAQINILEPLAVGIPAIVTDAGDAKKYYSSPLEWACVPHSDKNSLIDALVHASNNFEEVRKVFCENGKRLNEIHGAAAERQLIQSLLGVLKNRSN